MQNLSSPLCFTCLPDGQKAAEIKAKLRILRSNGVGPVTYFKWMARAENAQHILAEWRRFAGEKPLCDSESIDRECDALFAAGGWLLLKGETQFPASMAELPDTPALLSGLGNVQHLHTHALGVVGTRNASLAGSETTRTLAKTLAERGLTIVSGLARGIDTAAHTGALQGQGPTVAAVAGGVNHIYPPENAKLREAIIDHGCVLSEQPWGSPPMTTLFPRRNRIIAGLSVGVLVPEATRHSGSLITAEFALNYGREVWAIPGSPADARSGGPNWLLKQGAILVETVDDILATLPATPAPYIPRATAKPQAQATLFDTADPLPGDEEALSSDTSPASARQRVFGLLSAAPAPFDVLLRQSGETEATLTALLVDLELDGHATKTPDGQWIRG